MAKTLADSVRSILLSSPEVGPLQTLRRGSVLFTQKQPAAGLFLVESGLVKLQRTSDNGCSVILAIIGPHQFAGEEALAQPATSYVADVISLTDITGHYIPADTVLEAFRVPDFATTIVSYTIFRGQERVRMIELLALYDVEQRILHSLAMLAELVKPSADGSAFPIPITQMELASFVGATRETTSSMLSDLQNRRLVTLGRRLMTTVRPEHLLDAANSKLAKAQSS